MHQYTFALTKDDLVAAQTLHMAARLRRPTHIAVTFAIVFLVAAIAQHVQESGPPWEQAILQAGITAVLFTVVYSWLYPQILGAYFGRQTFRQQSNLCRPTTVEILPTSLAFRQEGGSNGQTPFHDYVKLREDDKVMVLYLAPRLMQILSKAGAPEEFLPRLRSEITAGR